jgi:hypothetical protein
MAAKLKSKRARISAEQLKEVESALTVARIIKEASAINKQTLKTIDSFPKRDTWSTKTQTLQDTNRIVRFITGDFKK